MPALSVMKIRLTYYRVRVGPIHNPEEMELLLEDLAEARYHDSFVVYE